MYKGFVCGSAVQHIVVLEEGYSVSLHTQKATSSLIFIASLNIKLNTNPIQYASNIQITNTMILIIYVDLFVGIPILNPHIQYFNKSVFKSRIISSYFFILTCFKWQDF
jgi:hypothetical protein